jgi:glycosyltransferase involved in cell wall biosynthesis
VSRNGVTASGRPGFVSVVVPCLNEEKYLPELFDALLHQHRPPDEVIVVEGGSSDASVDVIRAMETTGGRLTVRLAERPGGSIPENVNAGVTLSEGDVIVRLDAHSVPSPNYIFDALVHLQDPSVGVAGGVWDVAPGGATVTARAIARAVSHPLGAGDAAYRTGRNLKAPATVDTVPFGCFRREVWRELGGLDETLHTNEDYDFNYRVRLTGHCVFLDPRIRSTYYARGTLGALAKQYFRYGWWKVQMLRKHPESLRWRQAVPAAFVTAAVLLALGGLAAPMAWTILAGLFTVYAATVAGTSIALCLREGEWKRLAPLCAAFVIVHVCWGTGFILNLVTAARWPYAAAVAPPSVSPSSIG